MNLTAAKAAKDLKTAKDYVLAAVNLERASSAEDARTARKLRKLARVYLGRAALALAGEWR